MVRGLQVPSVATRADSLREYLTGAASDGGAQADPAAALGNYRSSTEVVVMDIAIEDAIPGVVIAYAGGGNAEGAGSLHAVDADTLEWKCYGGDYGVAVPIANGETKVLETALLPQAFLRVTRTTADALDGTATVALARRLGGVFAMDDVASAEALAGDTEYRATILLNESAVSVANVKRWVGELGTEQVSDSAQLGASGAGTLGTSGTFADWPPAGWCHIKDGAATREIVYYTGRTDAALTVPATGRGLLGTSAGAGTGTDTLHAVPGIAIAIDTDGVTSGGAAIQTIVDEDTAPAAVTWNTGITEATGLDIGDIGAGEQVGIWIKRECPPGTTATSDASVLLYDSCDAA